MTSTATEPAPGQFPELSVAAAAREAGDTWLRAGMYMRNYADMRTDTSSDRIVRARGEWGLALLEWVEALIAREAAKDRARARRLALPPSPGPGTSTPPVPVPGAGNRHGPVADLAAELRAARSQVSDREGSYTGIRMGSDQAATDQARSEWGQALADWIRACLAVKAAEDAANVAARRSRDGALKVNPADAFPPGPPTRASDLVRNSRERTRREAIQRDRNRYSQSSLGRPAAGRPGIQNELCPPASRAAGSPCLNGAGSETAGHPERVTRPLRAQGRDDQPSICGARTKRGRICHEQPLPGDVYCRTHRDKANRGLPV
jgi:hypothetical protein